MSEKLSRLGIDLPLLPLTTVGSFPKPSYLLAARRKYKKESQLLKNAETNATRYWISAQERLDFDVLVHGEMERGDMVAYFGEELEGFMPGGKEDLVRSYGNRFWIPPHIVSPVRWKEPLTLGAWEFAQSLTKKPVKGMLTGPATIHDWSLDRFYGNRHTTVLAIAQALRYEIDVLIQNGVKIIQIDEPSLAQTEFFFDTILEAFHIMIDGLSEKAYFIMHTCYGEDIFESLYPRMLELPVDNLDIETANSGMKFLHTIERFPVVKDLSLGFVDVHTRDLERVDTVRDWMRLALTIIPKEKLWLGPDCGLKTRTVGDAELKLVVLSAARDMIRACV
ncbi:MAG: methionine synthase [Candidatus Sungbacteria bacterium]|nr:methionine synthase [Candidatus Sungbacteria bacterium]